MGERLDITEFINDFRQSQGLLRTGELEQTVADADVYHVMGDNPKDEIEEARNKLAIDIIQDKEACWETKENWKNQSTYRTYRRAVENLHNQEKDYLDKYHGGRVADSKLSADFPHFMLETIRISPSQDERLRKAEFLLELLINVDQAQSILIWETHVVHAAIAFDTRKRNHGNDPDLTIFACSLLKEKAAVEISRTNERGENIPHLAIRHDLKGVREFIEKADATAFTSRRKSSTLDNGNTPLHDALGLNFEKKFIRSGPACKIVPGMPTKTPAVTSPVIPNGQEAWASSTEPTAETTADIATDISTQFTRQQSNHTRPRAELAISQLRESSISMCEVCNGVQKRNEKLLEQRLDIISDLLKRGLDALAVRNSDGLPPYLYLRAASEKYAKTQAEQAKTVPDIKLGSLPYLTSRQPCNWGSDLGRSNVIGDAVKDNAHYAATSAWGKELPKEEESKKEQADSTSVSKEERDGANYTVVHAAAGVEEAAGDRVGNHELRNLRHVDIGSQTILSLLKEAAFFLGGYREACACLIPPPTPGGKPLRYSDRRFLYADLAL